MSKDLFIEHQDMRVAFILSYLANVILAFVSLAILPDRIAIHFGLGGTPDGWSTNLSSTLVMLCIHTLVFCSLYFSPRLLVMLPKKWISLPNRDYWLCSENQSQALSKFSQFIWSFGAALFAFMLYAGLLTLKANLSDPIRLDEQLFLIGLVIFLGFTIYWTIALLRAFRIEKD